jgi:ribonucleoside-diphosphate reductase beta chain
MANLLKARVTYAPFEYPKAYDFFQKQQLAHWVPWEVQMGSDIDDWKMKLSDTDKHVIGSILKGFTQTEIFIQDYWSNKVANWFKKPEIQMMANTFAGFESIHAAGYSYLEESLGIQNYAAFLHDPASKAKIDRLIETKGKTKREIALSLAIFSGFNEGVNLFSSFAVLMSFAQRNMLKGLGQIVSWSVKDESLHSDAGCWLFREFIAENPDLFDDALKKEIYDAARVTVELEDTFIETAFEKGDLPNLSKHDLKNYIRHRANTKLQDLGLKSNWKNLDKEALQRLEWFSILSGGVELQDFFAQKSTAYSKGLADFEGIWDSGVTEIESEKELNHG